MSRIPWQQQLQVPEALREQLHGYRRSVWGVKCVEAAAFAAASLLVAYLGVFALDRLGDTPPWLRAAVGAGAIVGCLAVPLFLHRWVWRFHRLEQLARLLSRKMPRIGDALLGVLELAENRWEQSRSRTLCQAAIEQVARDAEQCDFRAALPASRHRLYLTIAITLLFGVAVLATLFPAAAGNAWWRLSRPWQDTPRYTFAALQALPAELVVAHGEPFALEVQLEPNSQWRPARGRAHLGEQQPVVGELRDGNYRFELPPQIEAGTLRVRIGDAIGRLRIEPVLRPELTSIVAHVHLPEYLGRPERQELDARSGAVSLVAGSRVRLVPTANRRLTSAEVSGVARDPAGPAFTTDELAVDGEQHVELRWQDEHGLACKEPFTVAVTAVEDAAPQVACEDLPRGRVVLDTEQLVFRVRASDDFGVKHVGMAWRGVSSDRTQSPAEGRSLLAAGGYDQAALDVQGTFSAKSLGIEPQPIELRIFATDFYPDREPVYTAPYLLYVLNAEQHAIWITEQLARWHRQSLEVRDRELVLYESNKELRDLAPAELDRPDTRRRIERQASAERANARRLANLTGQGKELLRQAARNPEIGVGHLDRWAEMLQILEDIAANRMPSVADLLNEASQAARVAALPAGSAVAGQVRAAGSSSDGSRDEDRPGATTPPVPRIVDVESSQQPRDAAEQADSQDGGRSAPSLRLPVTTLMGSRSPDAAPGEQPAQVTVDQAVTEQRDLLAEFEKVANELNAILANLEGSTLVKRLKAASRQQYNIAGRIDELLADSFGRPPHQVDREARSTFTQLARQEEDAVYQVSYIMDDMAAYFERRRLVRFKAVLDDMRNEDVLGSLRQLATDIPREQGLSISQCEYWSDTLDRWAEDLVDPAGSGACPGGRSRGSLPPSIVLEVLQILEAEINLREETRVAEQARAAVEADEHRAEAERLAEVQQEIDDRVVKVIERIGELPDAEREFAREIALLGAVSRVMADAAGILARPETGPPAIAAETEAIELLLQSQRINPHGGGGGGDSPGGGGTGTTQDSALALLGAGLNEKEVRESRDTQQTLGESGSTLPEEFRAGLDQYFSRLEETLN